MFYLSKYASPLSNITLACDNTGDNLVGLWLEGQKYFGSTILSHDFTRTNSLKLPKTTEDLLNYSSGHNDSTISLLSDTEQLPIFLHVKSWLDAYFRGEKPSILDLPIKLIGSDFRISVWNILKSLPYGELITYGEIAKVLAQNSTKATVSCRAVGGAVGHNPISIIIPCHRVIGNGGRLTGYAGGINTKIELLKLEGLDVSKLK